MVRRVDLEGAAHLVLASGVRHLDEAAAVFEAMLDGRERRQRHRFLRAETIAPRVRLLRRLAEVHRPASPAVGSGRGEGVHHPAGVGSGAVGALVE